MQTRSGAEVLVDGDVVSKLHRAGTDPRSLSARLRIASKSAALLTPLSLNPERVGQRWRTRWPIVHTLQAEAVVEQGCAPWGEAGRLLADLHREPVRERPPVHGWPQRLRRAVDRLRRCPDAAVRAAAIALPDTVWCARSPDRPAALVHGDWHLGQLGRRETDSPWLLIDVDDLGVGDPAWDLARPAGFWAAGLVPDEDWGTFLDAYRRYGPALGAGDPWPVLEPFARAAVVHAAASGLVHGDADDTQQLLLAACARMR
ncbi:MAG: phosphotransferase family protein [Mycolicibacterium sp.]|uniref:phosphotransferase family protein n=1 Tax=Mycolicibacterium sp. TaxID=2320850 RepID=UPI003D0A6C7B